MRVVNARNLLRVALAAAHSRAKPAAIGWVLFSASELRKRLCRTRSASYRPGAALAAAIVCVDYRMVVALAPLMYIIAPLPSSVCRSREPR